MFILFTPVAAGSLQGRVSEPLFTVPARTKFVGDVVTKVLAEPIICGPGMLNRCSFIIDLLS
ncbi:hypothetical protein OFN33_29775, partial [Escherichia coli]|nr:hypothetical protein [Escherichia coli]